MVNTNRLRGIIAERGMHQCEVASALGISARTFYAKMKSGVFGTDEAEKMTRILNIPDPAEIFFGKK